MRKGTWWNEPMTRKNWAVLIVLGVGGALVEIGYLLYSESIKRFSKHSAAKAEEMFREAKERF